MSVTMKSMLDLMGRQLNIIERMEEDIRTMKSKFDKLNMNFEELKCQVAYLTSISNKDACELPLNDVPLECVDQNSNDEDEELIEFDDFKDKCQPNLSLEPKPNPCGMIEKVTQPLCKVDLLENEWDLKILTSLSEGVYTPQDLDDDFFDSETSSNDGYVCWVEEYVKSLKEDMGSPLCTKAYERKVAFSDDHCGVALNKGEGFVTKKVIEKETSRDHLVPREMIQDVKKVKSKA